MINLAKEHKKGYINLGLGVNNGIRRFKEKWGVEGIMSFFNPDEKNLRMIWLVEKSRKKSYLAGTTHLFPYSFKKSLDRLISNVDAIVLEAPVDEANMKKVIDNGLNSEGMPSLYNALDNQTIIKINKELDFAFQRYTPFLFSLNTISPGNIDWLSPLIKGLKPWMAFFNILAHYLRKRGWKHMMDVDAFKIAKKLGKDVYFLEKIEDHIDALDGIPFEKIVHFLKKIDEREECVEKFVDCYTKGYFVELISTVNSFPMHCPSVIDKRDPILYERMKAFLEKGGSIILVGVMHIPGIQKLLLDDGYKVEKI